MRMDLKPESALLSVTFSGTFSLKEAKRTFAEMLEAVALHKTQKVLVDGREIQGKPEAMERFYYGDFAARAVRTNADKGVSSATQFAFVLREPMLDPRRFWETVAVNRGMRVKAFENPEDARRWLGVAPSHQPEAKHAK